MGGVNVLNDTVSVLRLLWGPSISHVLHTTTERGTAAHRKLLKILFSVSAREILNLGLRWGQKNGARRALETTSLTFCEVPFLNIESTKDIDSDRLSLSVDGLRQLRGQ